PVAILNEYGIGAGGLSIVQCPRANPRKASQGAGRGPGGPPHSWPALQFFLTMPIYEYECRACGHQFELLVLKPAVAACPSCRSQDLEQLLSGFAVSSEAISKANVREARRKLATSSNYKDQKVAEAEEIKEHSPPPPPV